MCLLLLPSNTICLSLYVLNVGRLKLIPSYVLGFSQRHLVLKYLVVIMKGSEVRNNLCCHLGDIILISYSSF